VSALSVLRSGWHRRTRRWEIIPSGVPPVHPEQTWCNEAISTPQFLLSLKTRSTLLRGRRVLSSIIRILLPVWGWPFFLKEAGSVCSTRSFSQVRHAGSNPFSKLMPLAGTPQREITWTWHKSASEGQGRNAISDGYFQCPVLGNMPLLSGLSIIDYQYNHHRFNYIGITLICQATTKICYIMSILLEKILNVQKT